MWTKNNLEKVPKKKVEIIYSSVLINMSISETNLNQYHEQPINVNYGFISNVFLEA